MNFVFIALLNNRPLFNSFPRVIKYTGPTGSVLDILEVRRFGLSELKSGSRNVINSISEKSYLQFFTYTLLQNQVE